MNRMLRRVLFAQRTMPWDLARGLVGQMLLTKPRNGKEITDQCPTLQKR